MSESISLPRSLLYEFFGYSDAFCGASMYRSYGGFDNDSLKGYIEMIRDEIPSEPLAEINLPYAEGALWLTLLLERMIEGKLSNEPENHMEAWVEHMHTKDYHACNCRECMKVFSTPSPFISVKHPLYLDEIFCDEKCFELYTERARLAMPNTFKEAEKYEPEPIDEFNFSELLTKFPVVYGGDYYTFETADTPIRHVERNKKLSIGLKFKRK